jgi:hypothetical protein
MTTVRRSLKSSYRSRASAEEVVSYLETLAREAQRARKPVVGVPGNASFYKAGAGTSEKVGKARGLRLR